MKLSINPKNLFRSKKPPNTSTSFSKSSSSSSSSEPSSFNTVTSTSSYSIDNKHHHHQTPTSVLLPPSPSPDIIITSQELISAFKLIDHDGDGKIKIREMESLISRIAAVPDEIAEAMVAEIDMDGDGCVSVEEFSAIRDAFGTPVSGSDEHELRETFDVFDADHDGRITAEELMSVFEAIGDEGCTLDDCRKMIQSVDVNGDGYVCFQDFSRMMNLQQHFV